jgi:transmembrane sensor
VHRALAAGIALVVIIAGVAGWLALVGGGTYTTDIGEQRTIRLPDDSIVDLNARSRIRVRFSKAARTVELVDGQALFHVAKDPHRPFIVRSDTMAVRAVGTEFDVYRKGGGMVVTVVEGRVAVIPRTAGLDVSGADSGSVGQEHEPAASDHPSVTAARADPRHSSGTPDRVASDSDQHAEGAAAGEAVYLSAGEQLTVTPATASTPHRADVGAATAWLQRRLIFEDTPLSEVAEEFNRYSVLRLIIDDPELARKPISGVYSSSDPSALIGFLQAQPMLRVIETDREIRVTRRASAPDAHSGR